MHHFEAMKSSNVHFTFFRMGKILEGLLAGSVEAEVPHGVECLRDAKHIWERFGGVEDQLKHATFNTVLHGVEDLGHIIHDIANELEECKATVGTDLDKLREMSKAFTDPWYFIFHVEHDLIVNGQDVHHEIMDAQAQWENQHFYEYGHSVGLALSKIFLGGQMKNDIPAEALPKNNETTTETAQSSNDIKDESDPNYIYRHTSPYYATHSYYAPTAGYVYPSGHHYASYETPMPVRTYYQQQQDSVAEKEEPVANEGKQAEDDIVHHYTTYAHHEVVPTHTTFSHDAYHYSPELVQHYYGDYQTAHEVVRHEPIYEEHTTHFYQ